MLGTAWDVLFPILSDWRVKGVLLLLLAYFISGVLAALKRGDFRLGALMDWLAPVLYLVGGGIIVELIAAAAIPVDAGGFTAELPKLVWFGVMAAIIGKALANVRELGTNVPVALTDKPKLETRATP